MSLKLAGSVRSPCFGMGMMTLLVHSRGAVPVSNARFMILRANVSKGQQSPDRTKKSNSILFYQKIPLGG